MLVARAALPLLLGVGRRTVSMSIEVERKFEPPADIAELSRRVEANGGKELGSKSFRDVYYDTAACSLTRRDMWLRCREGSWELKLPVEEDAKRSGGERTVFREIEGDELVNRALCGLLDGGGDSLDATLRGAALAPFADFTTTRSKWALGGCAIDADVASFGHAVMEIEVLVAEAGEVQAAEAEIARVAELVGAQPLGVLGGKLETYIRRHAPDVLSALVDEGILQPS